MNRKSIQSANLKANAGSADSTAKLKPSSQRCTWIDHAKGIGILLVVYGYVARGVVTAGIVHKGYNHAAMDQFLYSFHMPLFFFLAGLTFLTSVNKHGRLGLAFRKIDTLLYPYVVWSVLQGGVEVLLANFTNHSISISDVWNHILVPRAQFWFLYALFFVSIVASILYLSQRAAMLVFVLVFGLILFEFQESFLRTSPLNFVAQYFVYFSAGVLFAAFAGAVNEYPRTFLFVVLPLFILVRVGQHIWWCEISEMNFLIHSANSSIAVSSILVVIALSMSLPSGSYAWLAYVGRCSMGIYLMHVLAGSGIRVLIQQGLGIQDFSIHVAAGTLGGILLPIAGLKIISFLSLSFLLQPAGRFRLGEHLALKYCTCKSFIRPG